MHDTVVHDSPGDPPDPLLSGQRTSPARRALTVLGLLALAASAIFGGNPFGLRERFLGSETPERRPAAVSRSADASTATTVAPKETALRSQPWWQRVRVLKGVGSTTTPTFSIDGGAVQWRLKWTCQSGQLVVRVPNRPRPFVDARCPGTGTSHATKTGDVSLEVTAEGAWQLEVDQQVEVPLDEAPLPTMSAPGTKVVATGSFYRIDQVGTGGVTVFRLADRTYAVRLENFFVTPNVDLEIRMSPLAAPRTTEEFLNAPSAVLAPLDVTAGSMNFTVPKAVDPTEYGSLVIWCPPLRSAYAAATLRPPE